MFFCGDQSFAATLWSQPGSTIAYDNGAGRNVLNGVLARDEASRDTLYFKMRITPLSDSGTEDYCAALELFEADEPKLGVGNSLAAAAYTAFVRKTPSPSGAEKYFDLRSADLDPAVIRQGANYELPRRGVDRTIIFKVQFVPRGDDLVTVWLNPDLGAGADEVSQPEELTTKFSADCSFDEIRLRHAGGGEGWIFSDLVVATSFSDLADPSSANISPEEADLLFTMKRFTVESWFRESGMPEKRITTMAQTKDGYLWMAAEGQLTKFDGLRFTAIRERSVTRGGSVVSLFGDSKGALWVGTADRGLTRYANGMVETITSTSGLPADTVVSFAESADGTIWVGTSRGLVSIKDGKVQTPSFRDSVPAGYVTSIAAGSEGSVWVAVLETGVFRCQNGHCEAMSPEKHAAEFRHPQALAFDESGRLWMVSASGEVFCFADGNWESVRLPVRAGQSADKFLTVETGEGVWIASPSAGLFRLRQGKIAAMTSTLNMAEEQIGAVYADRDGNIWIGGNGSLHLLRRRQSYQVGSQEGLADAPIAGLAEVSPGVIWAIQPGYGLMRWEGEQFRRVAASKLRPDDPLAGVLLKARNGECWLACSDGLLLYRDPQAAADESQFFTLPGVHILSLAEADDGSVLAGSSRGEVWRLQAGRWRRLMQLEESVPVTAITTWRGTTWAGTHGAGLFAIGDSVERVWKRSNGLASDFVTALRADAARGLWIATDDGGMSLLSNMTCVTLNKTSGLAHDTIHSIIGGADGLPFWLHDGAGISQITGFGPKSGRAEASLLFPIANGDSRSLTTNDLGALVMARSYLTASGRAWIASRRGIVVADLANRVPPTPRTLLLEDLLLDGFSAPDFRPISSLLAPVISPAVIRVPPGVRRIEIQFSSPEFQSPPRSQLQYRMEGLDVDWVEAGNSRSAQYGHLPPGDYRFVVRLTGMNGAASEAALNLRVLPHFLHQWWVVSGGVIFLVSVIAGGVRYAENRRMQSRMRSLEQMNALERERRRIAQDLHDEMGAKLCRLSFLSEHVTRLDGNSTELREQMSSIASESRDLVSSLDQIVWVVNPQNDTVEHVASYLAQYAQNYFQGTGIECELAIPAEMPDHAMSSQVRHHLLLSVHEALTNVLKHSGATCVRLSLSCAAAVLTIRVADNGRGLGGRHTTSTAHREEASGDGLPNLRQRMADVGGQCQIESNPGKGTTVLFSLPLNLEPK